MMTKETDPVIVALRQEMAEYRKRLEALERSVGLQHNGIDLAARAVRAAVPHIESAARYRGSRKL